MSRIDMPNDAADTSAHDAAMAAAGEQVSINGQPPAAGSAQRPEGVPEKFWDAETGQVRVEALLESYKTLESSRSKPEDKPAEPPAEPPADETSDSASPVSKAAKEFEETGKLSEETFAELEKAGIDRATTEAYLSGIQAIQQLAFVAAGGEEAYGQMIEWAGKNLTPAEIQAYDAAVGSNDPRVIAETVQALSTRYRANSRSEPDLVRGRGQPPSAVEGYRSKAEMTAAMSDPRYRTDPAYRQDVATRIAAAERAGTQLFM
jgi:hypothetical protein